MRDYYYLPTLIGCLVAFGAVSWVYFKVLTLAMLKGLVDNPDARKLQKTPVPVMGGVAVFFGILCGGLTALALYQLLGCPIDPVVMPALLAMGIMLYVGALDDMLGLTPRSRLVIETLAVLGMIYTSDMCIDTFRGMWGIMEIPWSVAVPLTVFAGVGIINAINMIDGVNGLSSGLCITCSLLFGCVFLRTGDLFNASLAFIMAAALVPFFIHNVFGLKSRMFIGDAGTMVMGILMTWFLINMLSTHSPILFYKRNPEVNMIAMGLAVLSVPVFDTLRVMTMRVAKGKSPFSPDKTHLHHAFVGLGISHFVTAMCEIFIGILVFVVWAFALSQNVSLDGQLYIVIGVSAVLVWGSYGFLSCQRFHQTSFVKWIIHFSPKTHMGRTDWWKRITAWLDAPGDYSNF